MRWKYGYHVRKPILVVKWPKTISMFEIKNQVDHFINTIFKPQGMHKDYFLISTIGDHSEGVQFEICSTRMYTKNALNKLLKKVESINQYSKPKPISDMRIPGAGC